MDGILPVWKTVGMTSYDVIRVFKRVFSRVEPGRIKIGHAGTLDPFAEGVLILMLGRSTNMFDEIQKWPKTYRAVARLGAKSDTLDRTGKIENISLNQYTNLSIKKINNAAEKFVGEIEQIVPQYSAAKYKGKPLYKYARKGEETPEKKKKVTVYSIKVERIEDNEVEFLITCSSGTYIRQLSYDIFHTLGTESYLDKLVREKVGEIDKEKCLMTTELTDGDTVRRRVQLVLGE